MRDSLDHKIKTIKQIRCVQLNKYAGPGYRTGELGHGLRPTGARGPKLRKMI